jgi:hypothetical protein
MLHQIHIAISTQIISESYEVLESSSSHHAHWCHTLKYLILGCEYLLKCVHLSIGFFENFKDFFQKLFSFSVELNPFIGKL